MPSRSSSPGAAPIRNVPPRTGTISGHAGQSRTVDEAGCAHAGAAQAQQSMIMARRSADIPFPRGDFSRVARYRHAGRPSCGLSATGRFPRIPAPPFSVARH
jgi:hypothetical protein